MLLVDCGLTFPEDEFGVDIILPDWTYVMDNLDRLDAVLLTHGHEDHIGALPFFLQEVDVPVYSGRLTLA
ncbi:MAG: MBL fold metallo-hydrolase, partial [Phycisphaerales bacterium]